jgi:hypothetical protein
MRAKSRTACWEIAVEGLGRIWDPLAVFEVEVRNVAGEPAAVGNSRVRLE